MQNHILGAQLDEFSDWSYKEQQGKERENELEMQEFSPR